MKIRGGRGRRGRFYLGYLIGLTLIGLFVGLRLWDPTPIESVRQQTFDFYQRLAPRQPPTPEQMARVKSYFGDKLPKLDAGASEFPVAIIDIDENSLRAFGQWPWPRTRLAELVDTLTGMGAVAIAFDAIFPEEDRMSPGNFMREVPTLDKETRALLATLPSNDQLMADAMRRSKVVLGQSGVRGDVRVEAASEKTSIALIGGDPIPHLVKFPKLLPNVQTLERAAAGRGLVSIRPERDGAVRRIPAVMAAGGRLAPALSMELLRVALDETTILVRSSPTGVQNIVIGSVPVPTDENGQLWVHFAPQDPARYIAARDILLGAAPPDAVDGKLVLIGASAIGLLDRKTTAIDSSLPGVEIHAQMLETILTGAQLVRPDYALGLELVAAVLVGLFIVLLAPRLSAASLMTLGFVVAASLAYASWHAFTEQQLLFDVSYPLLSSFAIFGILMFYNYLREERERDWIRGAFGRYLAPDVVERMAVDDQALELGGESRRLTLLFSDVRGFTGISEQYRDDPQGLTALMNRFLTPLSNAIIERGGTIDKYMGDAIMAFWNAPLDVADHEVRACEAALDMRRRLDALNAVRKTEAEAAGLPFRPLDVGVGVNSGTCVVGNMGSELRFDYSVLGDAVNLASRFEGLTAQYQVEVLVGSDTAEACGDRMALIEVDRIVPKGKSEPEAMYALIGDGALAADPAFARLKSSFAEMIAAYRGRDWDGAEARIEALHSLDPEGRISGLLDMFAARVAAFRAAPPPQDWDGVFAATRK